MKILSKKFSVKSQIYGQIFIYILTIVLVSFILVFGYNAIQNIRDKATQIECLNFKNDLRNSIEIISSDFGRIKKADIGLCSPYRQVCFVETFKDIPNRNAPRSSVTPIDPIIKDSIMSKTDKNTFLVDKTAKDSFYAGNISIADPALDVLCVNAINGKISLKMEVMGNHVEVSQWA